MRYLFCILACVLGGCSTVLPGGQAALEPPVAVCRVHAASVFEAQKGVVPWRATLLILATAEGRRVYHAMNVWKEADGSFWGVDNTRYVRRIKGENPNEWAKSYLSSVRPFWSDITAMQWRQSS